MKKAIILSVSILLSCIAHAQNRKADEQSIEKQVDAMVNSWNKHDHSDLANYTTADCEWVNIVGMWWKSRKEMSFSLKAYHNTMFKNTPMQKKGVTIRFLSKDVALVHFKSHVGTFTTPNGTVMPPTNELALLVYVKQNGKWLMTSGENVVVDGLAQKNDPVLHMPKS
jgi:uncharacterized protein (TIGR02246 family)